MTTNRGQESVQGNTIGSIEASDHGEIAPNPSSTARTYLACPVLQQPASVAPVRQQESEQVILDVRE